MKLPFKTHKEKQAVIFIGIQASGKTTLYTQVMEPLGYRHINLDTLHTRNKEHEILCECLKNGESFVVDNTNPAAKDRERYIPAAKENGYEVVGIFFQSIVKYCIARNEKRANAVPAKAIPCTQNNLQLPAYCEGFDKLYFVKIGKDGFEISDWKE